MEIFGSLQKSSKKNRRTLQSAQNDVFFEFFFNFRKLLQVFGHLRKSSQNFGNCCKMLKTTFSSILEFFLFLNLRKLSEVFGNFWKKSENVGKVSKRSSENFCKFSKIFGNLPKCSEMLGKLWKPSEIFKYDWRFAKFLETFQSLTPVD